MQVRQGWLLFAVLACFVGCNNSSSTNDPTAETDGPGGELPTVSIDPNFGEDDDEPDEDVVVKEPEQGTPEWHIREILRVRLMPFPAVKTASASQDDTATAPDPQKELAEQDAVRRERNEQVITLAKQAIALTHKNPEKEVVFNAAVHHLLDARLQLAIEGEQTDVDALYDICEALQQSKPNTEIASAAALTIVNFCHANAVRYAQNEPKWIQEFAKQAQLFATRVAENQAATPEKADDGVDNPRAFQLRQDASRAAQILLAAGQSCDTAGFPEDGKACYQMVKAKFPETPQAEQVVGILRRYNLKGKPLQFAGPTLDGNHLSIEDFKGKTVVIVFWSSQAKPFVDDLPTMSAFLNKPGVQKLVSVIGVALDTDESQLDAFLEQNALAWPQIFYSEPEKRGWGSPIANYYGINQLPTIWIVDSSGVVAETNVSAKELQSKLTEVVNNSRKTTSRPAENRVVPAGNNQPQK